MRSVLLLLFVMTTILLRAGLALVPPVVAVFVHDDACLGILLAHLLDLFLVVEAVSHFEGYLLTLLLVIVLALVQRLDLLERFQIAICQLVGWILLDAVAAQGVHITRDG